MTSRGIIYSATGQRFVEEAIASAKSSLRFNRVPHLICCDAEPGQEIDGVQFTRFEPCGNPHLDKIHNMARTPFGQTLFLDTDTYVTDDVAELFDLLTRFDIAAAHAPGYTKCDDRGQSEAFYDFNTGVIPYRMTPAVAEFLACWGKLCKQWFDCPPFTIFGHDQPAFRRTLWESTLLCYVLPPEYNYRTIFPARLIGKAKVIHGRPDDYEELAARVNAGAGHFRMVGASQWFTSGGGSLAEAASRRVPAGG